MAGLLDFSNVTSGSSSTQLDDAGLNDPVADATYGQYSPVRTKVIDDLLEPLNQQANALIRQGYDPDKVNAALQKRSDWLYDKWAQYGDSILPTLTDTWRSRGGVLDTIARENLQSNDQSQQQEQPKAPEGGFWEDLGKIGLSAGKTGAEGLVAALAGAERLAMPAVPQEVLDETQSRAFDEIRRLEDSQSGQDFRPGTSAGAKAGQFVGGILTAPASTLGAFASPVIQEIDNGKSLARAYSEGSLGLLATEASLAAGNLGTGLPGRVLKQMTAGLGIYGAEQGTRAAVNYAADKLGYDAPLEPARFDSAEAGMAAGAAAFGGLFPNENTAARTPLFGEPDVVPPKAPASSKSSSAPPVQGDLFGEPSPVQPDLFTGVSDQKSAIQAELERRKAAAGLAKEDTNRSPTDEAYLQRDYLQKQESKSAEARSGDTALAEAFRKAGVSDQGSFEPSKVATKEEPAPEQGSLDLQQQPDLFSTKVESKSKVQEPEAGENTKQQDIDAALRWANGSNDVAPMASEAQIAAMKARNVTGANKVKDVIGGNPDIVNKLNAGTLTTGELLQHVADTGAPEQAAWAKDALETAKNTGGLSDKVVVYDKNNPMHRDSAVKLSDGAHSGVDAWYDTKTKTTYVNPDASITPHIDTLNHEARHSVMKPVLDAGLNKTLGGKAQEAFDRFNRLFQNTRDIIRRTAKQRLLLQGKDLNDPRTQRELTKLAYGLENVHEHDSEMGSNQAYRDLLKSVSVSSVADRLAPGDTTWFGRAKNLWDAFGKAANKMLGRSEGHARNMYDMFLDHQQQLKARLGPDATQHRPMSLKDVVAKQSAVAPAAPGVAERKGMFSVASHIMGSIRAPRDYTRNYMAAAADRVKGMLRDIEATSKAEKVSKADVDAYLTNPNSGTLKNAPQTKKLIDTQFHDPKIADTKALVKSILNNPNSTPREQARAISLAKDPHQQGPVVKQKGYTPVDARAEALKTAVDRAETSARLAGMDALHDQGTAEGWIRSAPTNTHSASIDNAKAGALRGMYTAPSVKGMLDEHFGPQRSWLDRWTDSKLTQGYQKFVRGVKILRLTTDPGYYAMYALGGPSILLNNNVASPAEAARGLAVFMAQHSDVVRNSALGKKLAGDLEDARKMGLMESTAFGEGFAYQQQRAINQILNSGKKTAIQEVMQTIGNGIGNVQRAGTTALAATDAYAKIAAGLARRDVLTKYYQRQAKKGQAMPSKDDILREASDWVSDTSMTHSRTSATVKSLERLGITQGASYAAETVRNTAYAYVHGLKDIIRGYQTGDVSLAMNGAKQLTYTSANLMYASKAINVLAKVGAGAAGLTSTVLSQDDPKQKYLQEEGSRYRGQTVSELSDPNNPNSKYTYMWTPGDRNSYYYQVDTPLHAVMDVLQAGDKMSGKEKMDRLKAGADAMASVFFSNAAVNRTLGMIEGKVPYWEKTKDSEAYQTQLAYIKNQLEDSGINKILEAKGIQPDQVASRLLAAEELFKPGFIRNLQIARGADTAPPAIRAMIAGGLGVEQIGKDTGIVGPAGSGTAARIKNQIADAHKEALADFSSETDLSDRALERAYRIGFEKTYKTLKSLGHAYTFGKAEGVSEDDMLDASQSGGLKSDISGNVMDNDLNPAELMRQNLSAVLEKQLKLAEDDPQRQEKLTRIYEHKMDLLDDLTDKYEKLTNDQIEAL